MLEIRNQERNTTPLQNSLVNIGEEINLLNDVYVDLANQYGRRDTPYYRDFQQNIKTLKDQLNEIRSLSEQVKIVNKWRHYMDHEVDIESSIRQLKSKMNWVGTEIDYLKGYTSEQHAKRIEELEREKGAYSYQLTQLYEQIPKEVRENSIDKIEEDWLREIAGQMLERRRVWEESKASPYHPDLVRALAIQLKEEDDLSEVDTTVNKVTVDNSPIDVTSNTQMSNKVVNKQPVKTEIEEEFVDLNGARDSYLRLRKEKRSFWGLSRLMLWSNKERSLSRERHQYQNARQKTIGEWSQTPQNNNNRFISIKQNLQEEFQILVEQENKRSSLLNRFSSLIYSHPKLRFVLTGSADLAVLAYYYSFLTPTLENVASVVVAGSILGSASIEGLLQWRWVQSHITGKKARGVINNMISYPDAYDPDSLLEIYSTLYEHAIRYTTDQYDHIIRRLRNAYLDIAAAESMSEVELWDKTNLLDRVHDNALFIQRNNIGSRLYYALFGAIPTNLSFIGLGLFSSR